MFNDPNARLQINIFPITQMRLTKTLKIENKML